MAAIDEYLSALQDQYYLVKKKLAKFETKNNYLYLLVLILVTISIALFWYWVNSKNPNFFSNGGWFIVLYMSAFAFGIGVNFTDTLGKFLIKNYSSFKSLKKEAQNISERLA